ncbi:MAG: hypothetical protein WCK39_07530 [Methanomassiliicoccales archaeon]
MRWWAQRDFGLISELDRSEIALSQGIVEVCHKAERERADVASGKMLIMSVAAASVRSRP